MGKRILGWFGAIIVFFLVVGVAMTPIEEELIAEQSEQSKMSAAAHEDSETQEPVTPNELSASAPVLPVSEPIQETEQTPASDSAELFEAAVKTETEDPEVQADYILNINSGKFHDPSCPSVDLMNESNKSPFVGTRDEAVAQGYVPCLNCNP